jgi:hypothetical protein
MSGLDPNLESLLQRSQERINGAGAILAAAEAAYNAAVMAELRATAALLGLHGRKLVLELNEDDGIQWYSLIGQRADGEIVVIPELEGHDEMWEALDMLASDLAVTAELCASWIDVEV